MHQTQFKRKVRLAICEPSLIHEGGHYLSYALMVAKAAAAQELDPVIFGNVKYSGHPVDGIQIVPVFTHDVWGHPTETGVRIGLAEKLVFFKLLDFPHLVYATEKDAYHHYQRNSPEDGSQLVSRLAAIMQSEGLPTPEGFPKPDTRTVTRRALRDARRIVGRLRGREHPGVHDLQPVEQTSRVLRAMADHLSVGDHIFFPSMSYLLAKAIGRCFETFESAKDWHWHVLFRRNIIDAGSVDKDAHWAAHSVRHAIRHMTSRAAAIKLRLYTDTEQLTEEYGTIIGLPFHTMPIPAVDAVDVADMPVETAVTVPTRLSFKRQGGLAVAEILELCRFARRQGLQFTPDAQDDQSGLWQRFIPIAGKQAPGGRTIHVDLDGKWLETALVKGAPEDDVVVVDASTYQRALATSEVGIELSQFALSLDSETLVVEPTGIVGLEVTAKADVVKFRCTAVLEDGQRRVWTGIAPECNLPLPLPVPGDTRELLLQVTDGQDNYLPGRVLLPYLPGLGARVALMQAAQPLDAFLADLETWLGPPTEQQRLLPPNLVAQPLTIGYLGDARQEKGYPALCRLAEACARDKVLRERVRFIVQSNLPENDLDLEVLKARQFFMRNPAATVITESLKGPEYADKIRKSDILWIGYNQDSYFSRSSGIFAEAVAAGRPVIVSSGSWMASCLDAFSYSYHRKAFAASPVLGATGNANILPVPLPERATWLRCRARDSHLEYDFDESAFGSTCLWVTFRAPTSRVPFLVTIIFRDEAVNDITCMQERFVGLGGMHFSLAMSVPAAARSLWMRIDPVNAPDEIAIQDLEITHFFHPTFVPAVPGGFKINWHSDVEGQCKSALFSYLTHRPIYDAAAAAVSDEFRKFHNGNKMVSMLTSEAEYLGFSSRTVA